MSRFSSTEKRKLALHHYTAVRNAIAATLDKCRKDIDDIFAKGRKPHDYSLGFTNALVMVAHHLSGEEGAPKFYDHQGTIGILPKPVRFTHEQHEEDLARAEFEVSMAQILARTTILLDRLDQERLPLDLTREAESLRNLIINLEKENLDEGKDNDNANEGIDAGSGSTVAEPTLQGTDPEGN